MELEKVEASSELSRFFHQSKMEEDDEESQNALEQAYIRIYKLYHTRPRKCKAFDDLRAIKKEMKLSYHERKQEYKRLSKELEAITEDPKLKEIIVNLETAKKETEHLETAYEDLEREENVLNEQVNEKEKRQNDVMRTKRKDLAEKEKALAEAQEFIEETVIENKLTAEFVELEAKLKLLNQQLRINDEDDDSSISGFVMDTGASMPIIVEKVTTDLASFFKNPNDFPDLLSTLASPVKNKVAAKPVAKKQKTLEKAKTNSGSTPSTSGRSSSSSKKSRTHSRHLKQQNSNEHVRQSPKEYSQKSPASRRSSSQNISPQVTPRQLRSSGSKRKSQEFMASESEEEQLPVKILRVEILAKPYEKIQEPSNGIVDSSEPEQVNIQPRNLSKEFRAQQEKLAKNTPKPIAQQKAHDKPHSSPEDPRDPVKDGQHQLQTDQISIPETPTTEEEKVQQLMEPEGEHQQLMELEGEHQQLMELEGEQQQPIEPEGEQQQPMESETKAQNVDMQKDGNDYDDMEFDGPDSPEFDAPEIFNLVSFFFFFH
jgi:hypothetical protein